MEISTRTSSDIHIVAFAGNLDSTTSPEAQKKLDAVLADARKGSARLLGAELHQQRRFARVARRRQAAPGLGRNTTDVRPEPVSPGGVRDIGFLGDTGCLSVGGRGARRDVAAGELRAKRPLSDRCQLKRVSQRGARSNRVLPELSHWRNKECMSRFAAFLRNRA